jgi:ribonuclease VapC
VRRLVEKPSEGTEISVLDASAVLAYLHSEDGFHTVRQALDGAVMSAVNLAEVRSVVTERGADADRAAARLLGMGVRVEPFDASDAAVVGALRPSTKRLGLSLADRACLALGLRLGRPVLATDAALAEADVGVEVVLIR